MYDQQGNSHCCCYSTRTCFHSLTHCCLLTEKARNKDHYFPRCTSLSLRSLPRPFRNDSTPRENTRCSSPGASLPQIPRMAWSHELIASLGTWRFTEEDSCSDEGVCPKPRRVQKSRDNHHPCVIRIKLGSVRVYLAESL